jgi:peptidoglycan-N-acetylglucosamine deacetylase
MSTMKQRWERRSVMTQSGGDVTGIHVTTSWDDGHMLDHKLAALLEDNGLCGTFYVAPKNVELPQEERLRDRDLRSLASHFEIGGHTLNHMRLTVLSDEVASREVADGKDALEQIIGMPLRSFCYPGGEYSRQHPEMVRAAGFQLARTTCRGVTGTSPRYETHTTVHAYCHPSDTLSAYQLSGGNIKKAYQISRNWDVLAMTMFDRVLASGGIFHLWGHSWEIDQNEDWDRLIRVFRYIGNRPNVNYVENGGLASIAK